MSKRFVAVMAICAFLLAPTLSYSKFPGILKRLELGYTMPMMEADYFASISTMPGNLHNSMSYSFTPSSAMGGVVGTSFPLTRLGKASALVLSASAMYNMLEWKEMVNGAPVFAGSTTQMALPIGLDVKVGPDALVQRGTRFGGSIGAGVFPSYSIMDLEGFNRSLDPMINVNPYVKAEVGVMLGLFFKVRALYSFGSVDFVNFSDVTESELFQTSSEIKFTSNSHFALSFIVMPFSYTWKVEEWWNTY